jgi:FkbM family methyltransferase
MISQDDRAPTDTDTDASWKARCIDARRAVTAAKRQILDPATLQGLLESRLRTLSARTLTCHLEEREAGFLATCQSYRDQNFDTPSTEHGSIDGLRWSVPATPNASSLPKEWLQKQFRFPYNTVLQTRDVSIGGLMLDIGANVGRTAIPRVVLGDVTGVYCAEPDPTNYYCLRRNVLDNSLGGFVMPDQVAISDHDGVVGLHRARKYTGHRVAIADAGGAGLIEVQACTLDTWVQQHQIDLDAVTFIKVDVEGYELQVMAGARDILTRRHIAWQLEVWAPQLSTAGGSASQLAELLGRHFTHFIDLRRNVPGSRVSSIDGLHAVAVELDRIGGKTDVVVFNATGETRAR